MYSKIYATLLVPIIFKLTSRMPWSFPLNQHDSWTLHEATGCSSPPSHYIWFPRLQRCPCCHFVPSSSVHLVTASSAHFTDAPFPAKSKVYISPTPWKFALHERKLWKLKGNGRNPFRGRMWRWHVGDSVIQLHLFLFGTLPKSRNEFSHLRGFRIPKKIQNPLVLAQIDSVLVMISGDPMMTKVSVSWPT